MLDAPVLLAGLDDGDRSVQTGVESFGERCGEEREEGGAEH